jgi:acetyltransferase-like isoleucine patch superfamily enzyme
MRDDSGCYHKHGEHSFIHKTAVVGKGTVIGEFCIIEADCTIGRDCLIGDFAKLAPGTLLGNRVHFDEYSNSSGAVVIGDDVFVKRMAIVGQGAIVEDKAFIGPMTILVHEKNVSWQRNVKQVSRGVYVRAGVIIGSRVVVNSGVTVDYNAVVGAGSVVTHDCQENGIFVGVPAAHAGIVPPKRRVVVTKKAPLCFRPKVLREYLPHLQGCGRFDV